MEQRAPLAAKLCQQVVTSVPFPTIKAYFITRYIILTHCIQVMWVEIGVLGRDLIARRFYHVWFWDISKLQKVVIILYKNCSNLRQPRKIYARNCHLRVIKSQPWNFCSSVPEPNSLPFRNMRFQWIASLSVSSGTEMELVKNRGSVHLHWKDI